MERKAYWDTIYQSKATTEVSWFQEHAETSLEWIIGTGIAADAAIIDVGGGTSSLVDDLLAHGCTNVAVLDVSGASLRAAQTRLGPEAGRVTWLEADITQVELPPAHYVIWHDRAVFHFLTAATDRARYISTATAALQPGGHLIIATFAADGPQQCSGLATARYSPEELRAALGAAFDCVKCIDRVHITPFGTQQKFTYCHFQKRG